MCECYDKRVLFVSALFYGNYHDFYIRALPSRSPQLYDLHIVRTVASQLVFFLLRFYTVVTLIKMLHYYLAFSVRMFACNKRLLISQLFWNEKINELKCVTRFSIFFCYSKIESSQSNFKYFWLLSLACVSPSIFFFFFFFFFYFSTFII